VRKATADIAARRGSGGDFVRANYFQIGSGENACVRFLEQDDDVAWCWVHQTPAPAGRQYGDDVACLDQEDEDIPCPGCEDGLKRKFKGFINVIWFDGPVYKRDAENKLVKKDGQKQIIDTRDQVALWTSGSRVFENLEEINTKYKGLSSRKFEIKRKGEKLDTTYLITPWDVDSGREDFSSKEEKLLKDKHDLNLFTKPPSYEEFRARLDGKPAPKSSGDDSSSNGPAKPNNPFAKGGKKKPSRPVKKPSRPSR
jgi:hypothetical protein